MILGRTWGSLVKTVCTATGLAIISLSSWTLGQTTISRNQQVLDEQDPLLLPAVLYETGGGGKNGSVAVADLNGDGNLDVVVANQCHLSSVGCSDQLGVIGVLLGKGDGTLEAATTYESGGCNDVRAAVGDVNGDHNPDIVVINGACSNFRFGVLWGKGDGTFHSIQGVGQRNGHSLTAVALADVNADGVLDVLTADPCFTGCHDGAPSKGAIGLSLGNGNGTFKPTVNYSYNGDGPFALTAADVNGDGKTDLLSNVCPGGISGQSFCLQGGAVLARLGKGDGTFKGGQIFNYTGDGGFSIIVADLNQDEKQDVLLTNGGAGAQGDLTVLLGNGDGTFQSETHFSSGGDLAKSALVEDIDGDGKADVLTANSLEGRGSVELLLGHGTGMFTSPASFLLPNPIEDSLSIAAGDLNGDGRPDVVVSANTFNDSGRVAVLLNNTGTHTASTTSLVSDLNPTKPNQLVTYSATVSSDSGRNVTGSIIFRDGPLQMAEVDVTNGRADYTTTYKWGEAVRAHSITAKYSGDLFYSRSVSPELIEYVGVFPAGTRTVVTTSASPAKIGQPVTFTATVSASDMRYGIVPDGGVVRFYDGTALLGSSTLTNQHCLFVTSALSAKVHTIRATYVGNPIFKTSNGAIQQSIVK